MQGKYLQRLSVLVCIAAAVAGIWLSLRFLLPWAAPFLLAFALAALMELPVGALVRRRWKRPAAAGLVTLSFLGLLLWAVVKLTAWLASSASSLAGKLPLLMENVSDTIDYFELRFAGLAETAPEGLGEYMKLSLEAVGDVLYSLPASISQWALDFLAKAAQSSPNVLLFAVTAGIGTYFISASFPKTTAFLLAQVPLSLRERLSGFGQDIRSSFGGFMRSQLMLMVMTFFQLLIVFLLLKIKSPVLLAFVSAVVDALPVFGTGIILVPWAVYELLIGSTMRGLGLLIAWLTVNLVRSCAQAKLLGDQIGLDPLASLLAIYVGWKVWKVWGMLLFPLVLVTLQQLNDKGVIKLWNRI